MGFNLTKLKMRPELFALCYTDRIVATAFVHAPVTFRRRYDVRKFTADAILIK